SVRRSLQRRLTARSAGHGMKRATMTFVVSVELFLSVVPQPVASQEVAACPQGVSLAPSLVPPESGRFLNRIETTVTPALNIRPVTYDSTGRNAVSETDAFHVLYFVERRVPGAGSTAIADTLHILTS